VQLTDDVTFCTIGLTNGSRCGPLLATCASFVGAFAVLAAAGVVAGFATVVAETAVLAALGATFAAGFEAAEGFGAGATFAAGFDAARVFCAGAGCAFWTAAFFDSVALFTVVFVEATGF
jgi:hypothetical protein